MKKGNGSLQIAGKRCRRIGAVVLTTAMLMETILSGSMYVKAASMPENAAGDGEVAVETESLQKAADYTDAGTDIFPIGETRTYKFGTAGQIKSFTAYSESTGFGWQKTENVKLASGRDFVSGTNYMDSTAHTWEYPTFLVDVPAGIYDVTIIQGTDGKEKAVNGAYVEGNMYSVRWSTESFSTGYTMPSETSWIYTEPGEEKVSEVKTAVVDGQLTIEFATSLTDAEVSGKTYIKEVQITRVEQITEPSAEPTLRFIGDSTLAKYPPEDGQVWTPIPERTGWGEEFSMGRFVDDSVVLVNKAVAGSSIKSWIYEGYLNDFLMTSHPGDTVIIEGGINDNAEGRRKSTGAEFKEKLQYFVDVLETFGLDVIISSGTKSAAEYVKAMKEVATENNLHYVDLLGKWNGYGTGVNLTVDGTHLNRLGGIVAAQIVAADIKDLPGLSISGHVKDVPVNTSAPTATVSNLRVKKQGSGFISLQWNLPESTIYDPNQLIGAFDIYRKAKGTDVEEKVYTQTALLSADMTQPQLFATFPAPVDGDYIYFVKAVGAKGEGPASAEIEVPAYNPVGIEALTVAVNKYRTQLYDGSVYSIESAAALQAALTEADKCLADPAVSAEQCDAKLAALNTAADGLKKQAETLIETTFEEEELKKAAWGVTGTTGGNPETYLSAMMDLEGNRLLKMETGSQSGNRGLQKDFADADAVDAAVELVEFEWYPGIPDRRNCTELEFYSAAANERVLSLKSAKINDTEGHIGYVVGNYPNDTSYLTGTGFHEYKDSRAVDLGLPSDAWYNVKIAFHFKKGTADLFILPRDDASIEGKVVKDIPITATKASIKTMKFLLMRGKQDNGTTNDLSLLWTTYLDNYAIYYAAAEDTTGAADAVTALNTYREKSAGLNSGLLAGEKFTLANAVADILEQDAGFFNAQDYAYAKNILSTAVAELPVLTPATAITFGASAIKAGAGDTIEPTVNLVPAEANEEIVYTSSDEEIASVAVSAGKLSVTAKKNGTATITATGATSGVTASFELTVSGQRYMFGTDTAKAYDAETGYGFINYSYPNEAEGWKDYHDDYDNADKKAYIRRELTQVPGIDYINTSASGEDYLAVSGQVWTELPSGGRVEDKITYENTAAFAADLPNGNYHVNVTFTNPESAEMNVMVKTEELIRYSYGDHETEEIVDTPVPAGQTVTKGFDIAVTDGQLNLRFERNDKKVDGTSAIIYLNVADGAPAQPVDVYVKSVTVSEIDSRCANAEKPTVHILGDSTVQSYYTAGYRRSWAQYLYTLFGELDESTATKNDTGYDFMETDKVIFRNYARDGRSLKSILEEGRLNEALLNINPGDYVFVQSAHNDENPPRPNRYLNLDDFKKKISDYNKAVSERGATLVLVTPIVIGAWNDDGVLDHRFDDYRLAMMQVAKEENIPMLDLDGATLGLVGAMGKDNTNTLGIYKDTVHTSEAGGPLFTKLMDNLLRASEDEKLVPLKALMKEQDNSFPISIECADTLIVDPASGKNTTRLSVTAEKAPIGTKPTIYISDENVVQYRLNKLTAVGEGTAIVTVAYTTGDLATTGCTAYTAYKVINVKGQAADLTELNTAIAAAESLNESDYTSESYAVVKAALETAKALDVTDDQELIAAAAAALNEALANVVRKPDRTALNTAIAAAEAKAKADYTPDSYARLESALATAKAVGPDATAEEIAAAATALNSAISALVPVKTDNSETKPSETPSSETNSSQTPSSETPSSQAPAPGKGETFTSSDGVKYKVMTAGKEVAYTAPADKKNITSAAIPDTVSVGGVSYKVTSVANKAFEKAPKLKSVTIGKNVTSIGTNAFANCTKLTTVKFKGTKCKTIGTGAFKGAKALKIISIPNSVQKIGDSAFASCTKLSTVTIGTGLKEIGKSAFNGDKVLKTITIKSKKLAKVGSNALKSTKKNLTIKVPKKQVKSYAGKFKNKGNKNIKVTK